MKFTNEFNLPEPVVRALTEDNYSRGASNRSVTQLIDSPRIRILRTEYDDVITEDASERVWSVLGRAVHDIFEKHTPDDRHTAEERLFLETDGWTISGAIDLRFDEQDNSYTLTDYKCTSAWAVVFGKVEWVRQLNMYAWLARKSRGITIGKLQIIAVIRDFNRREAEKKSNKNYPIAPIVTIPVQLWSDEEQDQYAQERIDIHSDAEFERLTGGDLPLCSPDERWAKATTYAVKKRANKRAMKLFDSMEKAEAYFAEQELDKKHMIEVREGEKSRCAGNYCGVADICDQYQNELIQEAKDAAEF